MLKLKKLIVCLGTLFPSLVAFGFGGWCYVPTWFNVSQQCESCSLYTNCPGRVLCSFVEIGGYPGKISTGAVWCVDISGGTGNCAPPAENCTGGAPVSFSGPVVIPQQPCPGECP